jgi:DNA replication protein DnaC
MPLPGETEIELLREIGLDERELVADPKLVPEELRRLFPPQVGEFIRGDLPKKGVGIRGDAGVGKTCAMVAIIRLHFRAFYERRVQDASKPFGVKGASKTLMWVDWPRAAHFLRSHAVSDSDLVRRTVDAMATAKILFLDDLGAERRKGDYQDDYAAGELDYIVSSARYRACLPTWFTTNLLATEIAPFYGARFSSRLLSESPLVELVGPDRRSAGK